MKAEMQKMSAAKHVADSPGISADNDDNTSVEQYAEDSSDESGEDEDELIRLSNVHKTYLLGLEGVQALRGVNVSIRKGDFAIILGTSGGGKTTLLNIIGTIDKPTKVSSCHDRVISTYVV